MTVWIKCSDKLPKNGKYLVSLNKEISTAYFWNSEFYVDNNQKDDATITHWAELPDLPDENKSIITIIRREMADSLLPDFKRQYGIKEEIRDV